MSHKTIKEETKKLHKELDHLDLNKRVMSKSVTLKDYKLFLIAQFQVYAFLKLNLRATDTSLFKSLTDRHSALKLDLYKLEVELSKIPLLYFEKPDFNLHRSTFIGLQYVLEGSRHGAVYIKKHLKKELSLNDDYFNFLSYNSNVDWKLLIQQLDQEKDTFNLKKGCVYAYKLFITSFKASSLTSDE